MRAAADVDVLERARVERRVLVSADTDFATLLALQESSQPSFVLFRETDAVSAEQYANLLLSNLPGLEAELSSGCVAVFRGGRVRVRSLPISAG
jgi:predicted nuclease of predicted toxin-antitoxin system